MLNRTQRYGPYLCVLLTPSRPCSRTREQELAHVKNRKNPRTTPGFLCRSAHWVSWTELRTRELLSRRTVGPWQPFSHRQSGVRRPGGVRWGHRSGTGHSGHQIGAPALCDSIVEVIPMLVFCRFRRWYSGLSRRRPSASAQGQGQ